MAQAWRERDRKVRAQVPLSLGEVSDNPEDIVQALLKLEAAHWYYVDYVQPKNPELPPLRFKNFISIYLPWLRGDRLFDAMKLFNRYKKTLPIYGSIILTPEMDKVLLVQNVNSDSWSFPKGKQELNETEQACVIRETLEETGFNIQEGLDLQKRLRHRKATFFIIENVPEYTFFVPWKRTEISNVGWHLVPDLGKNPLYNIYIRHIYEKLHSWIEQRRISPKILPVIEENESGEVSDDEDVE